MLLRGSGSRGRHLLQGFFPQPPAPSTQPPFFRRQLGQAEIQNLGLATLGDKDIRWLDVPMDDPFRMGSVQRIGNLNRQVEQFVRS